jgi:hypothetical protein
MLRRPRGARAAPDVRGRLAGRRGARGRRQLRGQTAGVARSQKGETGHATARVVIQRWQGVILGLDFGMYYAAHIRQH